MERFRKQLECAHGPIRIAVADADGDGTNELLILIDGVCMADLDEYVYRYSEEKMVLNLNLDLQRDLIIMRMG